MFTSNLHSPYPTMPVFVFSLGSCNSVFRSSLCQSDCFTDLGDISAADFETVWSFGQEPSRNTPKAVVSTDQRRFECLDRYFRAHLKDSKPFNLIGVNYESLAQLRSESSPYDSPPELVNWLNATQFPVVHLVRKNPLDCLVDQIVSDPSRFADDTTSDLDVTTALARVSEMQRLVIRFRHWLAPANQIEFQFESLLDVKGEISRLAVHQFCGLLGIDAGQVKTRRVAPSTGGANQAFASRLKRQLRPAFMRVGYENLFQLPKAA